MHFLTMFSFLAITKMHLVTQIRVVKRFEFPERHQFSSGWFVVRLPAGSQLFSLQPGGGDVGQLLPRGWRVRPGPDIQCPH